jgi:hypothetical protein
MSARRLARYVARAALIGVLAAGGVYAATTASADEAPPRPEQTGEPSEDGAVWGASFESVRQPSLGIQSAGAVWF